MLLRPRSIVNAARLAPRILTVLALAFATIGQAAIASPPAQAVRDALTQAASTRLPPDARLARFTVALTALDVLAPQEVLTRLTALSRSDEPRVARRAILEITRLTGEGPSPAAPTSFDLCAIRPGEGTPLDALIAAHRGAFERPASCVASSTAFPWPLLPAPETSLHHLRVPAAGASELFLSAEGDLVISTVDARGVHTWLGHQVGLRAPRQALGSSADQLSLRLPEETALVLITVATPHPRTRISIAFDTPPSASTGVGTVVSGPPTGPLRPLPTLGDDDLFGHAARRLLGLPDLGSPLEERLGLALNGTPKRPLRPNAADLVLCLPAITRLDQRASLTGLYLTRLPPGGYSHERALLELASAHLALDRGQVQRARAWLDSLALHPDASLRDELRRLGARIARYEGHPEDTIAAYGVADLSVPTDLTEVNATSAPNGLATLGGASTLDRLELAQAATELGRADLSAALRRELAATFPGRLDLGTAALAALVGSGQISDALALADSLADRHPRPLIQLDAAERHLARDTAASRERALVLTRRALEGLSSSADADALVRAGLLFEALDEPRASRETFARALAASPGHPSARHHLERLDSRTAARNPLTLDALALAETPVLDPEAPFEVLGEETVVQVAGDGTTTRWVRRVLRAQRVPDRREARTHRIRFDPSRESVTVVGAHIHHVGTPAGRGRKESVVERHVHSLTEDWYGLYYDLRQLSIPFDRLDRDDLIEVSWRVDPVGQLFPGVVELFEVLSDRIPKHFVRFTVEHPASLDLRHRLALPPGHGGQFTVNESIDGDLHRLVLEGRGLPPLPVEPLSPGAAEVAPVWQVTSFATWDALARWYLRLIEPSRVPTMAMRELVASLSAGRSKDELIRALTTWVTREIRYVGLEFGIHGYRPYRTDEVFSRRFGDCKDKATLLVTLLSLAGVDAQVVLTRTRKQGRLDGALPTLALFDHAIVWLPSRLQLVDPTAIHHGLGELPREDQGAQILVLRDQADTTPDLELSAIDPASRNGIVGRYAVTLDRLGRGGLSAQVSMLGINAPLYRSMLLEPATRSKRMEEVLNRRYPGLSLSSLEVSDPADHHRPVDLVFTAEIPRLASRADGGQGLQIPRPAGVDGQLERLAPDAVRHLPLLLGPPMRWHLRFRYVFPEGYRATRLPEGGEGQSRFGHYRVVWSADGHAIDVETELELTVDQVSAADYPALRSFLEAFDRTVAPALIAAPPTPTPTPPAAPPTAPPTTSRGVQ